MNVDLNINKDILVKGALRKIEGASFVSTIINRMLDDFELPTDRIILTNPFNERRLHKYLMKHGTQISGSNMFNMRFTFPDSYSSKTCDNTLIRIEDGVYFMDALWDGISGTRTQNSIIFLSEINIPKFITEFSKKLIDFDNERIESDALSRIFLPDDIMADIREDVESFLASRDTYNNDLKLPWKRGYMLIGPPGNGKTLLIRQIAKMYGLSLIDITKTIDRTGNICMNDVTESSSIEGYVYPILSKPTVFSMEDIDKFTTYQSGSGDHADAGSLSLHQVLKGLDGIEETDGAIVIATTNYAEQLPEALVNRPGRFDRIWKIDRPKEPEIVKFLQYHKMSVIDGDLSYITSKLDGYSMAFVEELIKSLKKRHHKNDFTKTEVDDVINRIHKHSESYKKHFKEDKEGFGFRK
jgi:AAA+ superfamily predicted ATPase